MTWIKVCGTTSLEDARAAVEAGADALGFVFAESPRKTTPEAAAKIVSQLPPAIEKVGVFVDQPAQKIREMVEQVGLTGIQLHVDDEHLAEDRELLPWAEERGLRIIIAVSMLETAGLGIERPKAGAKHRVAMLLDSMTPSLRGGTGVAWDWKQFAPFVEAIRTKVDVIAAGGLKPENVQEAVRVLHPWGVDVASGVEREPGKKDHEKVRAFIAAVREAETPRG
jgi:phosphoribosylanthranilate isomerase